MILLLVFLINPESHCQTNSRCIQPNTSLRCLLCPCIKWGIHLKYPLTSIHIRWDTHLKCYFFSQWKWPEGTPISNVAYIIIFHVIDFTFFIRSRDISSIDLYILKARTSHQLVINSKPLIYIIMTILIYAIFLSSKFEEWSMEALFNVMSSQLMHAVTQIHMSSYLIYLAKSGIKQFPTLTLIVQVFTFLFKWCTCIIDWVRVRTWHANPNKYT